MSETENTIINQPVKMELKRGNWANKTEFVLSCAGYIIGLGNVWRFPYLCYQNGGGAFLVPYLLMLALAGIPLFFMETTLGQFGSASSLTIFRISPLFKGAGYVILIVNIICNIYCSVLIAYPLLFLMYSWRTKLPWMYCNNDWNTENCFELGRNRSNETNLFLNVSQRLRTSADEFFHHQILKISDGIAEPGGIVWPLLLCNMVAWVIAYLCIMNGVKSVAKVVKFTATFPFIILSILLIRGVTLPGAWNGIRFYIYPEWHQLTNFKVWADAAAQIFFSLGPGWGGIVSMSSFNKFGNNNKWDSILAPILNSCTSIFAGFAVFSVIGFMAHETGLPVSTVATGGPGLVFVTYPEAISMLPLPNLWAVLFFIMLFLLGLDTVFVQIETVISSIVDEYPRLRRRKKLFGMLSCFTMFLGSITCITNGGIYVLQLLDYYAISVPVILVCFVELLMVGWIYGDKKFVRDLEFMIKEKVHWWWPFCWKYITPAILMFILTTLIFLHKTITYNGAIYPQWSIYLGWSICCASIMCIPAYMVYKLWISPGTFPKRLKLCLRATAEWGPAEEEDRNAWNILTKNKEEMCLTEKT